MQDLRKLSRIGVGVKVGVIVSLAAFVFAFAAVSAGASGASGKNGFFKTPDNKIWCGWGTGSSNFIVCGVHNGFLKPKPANHCTHIDYVGNRIGMTGKGKAKVEACAGDAGPFANPKATKVLGFGKTWQRGPFTCKSLHAAVKCHNKAGHGFYIAKGVRYRIH